MLGYLRAANVRQARVFVEMCKLFRSTRFNETPHLASDLLNIQESTIIKCTKVIVNTMVMSLRKDFKGYDFLYVYRISSTMSSKV